MNTGTNFAEPLTRDEALEPSHADTTDDRRRGSAASRERELALWLNALRSFFNTRNQPFSETERGGMLTRDFRSETLIVQQILLQCSQLIFNLAADEGGLQPDAAAAPSEEERALAVNGDFAADVMTENSLVTLAEEIGDGSTICQAILKTDGGVSLSAWASLGRIVIRQLDRSEAATRITGGAEHISRSSLQPALLSLSETLTPDSLGADMLTVFTGLARLLEYLQHIEDMLRRDRPLKLTLPIFTLIYEETRSLLDMIETRVLRIEGLDGAVFDVLDGTAYAVGMELRKTFEHELVGFSGLQQARTLFAKVETAYGLLRDAFQQSTLALAQAFDPSLDGAVLFNSFHTKLEQSLALRRDLWTLLQLVRSAEQARDNRPLAPLLERLNTFGEGSMRYLMYKDWESYERFVEEVTAARGALELVPVFHRLGAFLETLFGQVNMRAVLSDKPFESPTQ